jgi:alpha-glucosidase (family GH31 glycosyl hydrolase)
MYNQNQDESACTGEPIVCAMEYAFRHQGYERIHDQFLLGTQILVAPVLEKGARGREVVLPQGTWKGFDGRRYSGPARNLLAVPLDDLCYFEKMD